MCPDKTEDNGDSTHPSTLPKWLRDFTSLRAYNFIQYMNIIGWPQDGIFSALLSAVGYDFYEDDVRMNGKVVHVIKPLLGCSPGEGLSVLIFGL